MFPFPQMEWIHEPPTFESDQIFRRFLLAEMGKPILLPAPLPLA